jgi:hypothetical protein
MLQGFTRRNNNWRETLELVLETLCWELRPCGNQKERLRSVVRVLTGDIAQRARVQGLLKQSAVSTPRRRHKRVSLFFEEFCL